MFCIRRPYSLSKCDAAEAHSEPSQLPKMEHIAKAVNS